MNTNEQSFIKVNLTTREFELSGDRDFIEKYFEDLKKLVDNQPVHTNQDTLPVQNLETNADNSNFIDSARDKYEKAGLYVIDSDTQKVIINKRIPGKNNAEKMKNIALITLFAKKTKIVGSEIKDMCKKQGCLDNNNFSAIFSRDYETFIRTGSGQKWSIELTFKGEEDAKKLLESMINE